MANGNKARKTFTDLSNPQQLRELNRQLEWVWNQLLGGLPAKALSNVGIKTVVSTVERLVAQEIEADKITTNVLVAALAKMMVAQIAVAQIDFAQITDANIEVANIAKAIISEAKIESAQIVDLQVEMLRAITAEITTADIAYAHIKDLAAGQAIIEDGVGTSLLIKRLYTTTANMLGATIGNLVLKGEDGGYYEVVIASDGTISTKDVTVTNGEIVAGMLGDGRQIVETDMNVRDLNATYLKAHQATIASIFTAALTAGKITAAEALIASATIPALYTASIQAIGNELDLTANHSINLMVGEKGTIYRSDTMPVDANPKDINIQPSTGYIWQLSDNTDSLPEFYLDENGFIYCDYKGNEDLCNFSIDDDGHLLFDEGMLSLVLTEDGTPVWWERVKDNDLKAVELRVTDDRIVGVVTKSSTYLDDLNHLSSGINSVQKEAEAAALAAGIAQENVDQAQTNLEQQISVVYSEVEQTERKFEVELGKKVGKDEISTYMRYEDGVLELGRSGSRYTTQTSDRGFVVLQDGSPMASMEQNTISAPVINAQRMFTIGDHAIRMGASGHLIFN